MKANEASVCGVSELGLEIGELVLVVELFD